jgi:hypothetical protein
MVVREYQNDVGPFCGGEIGTAAAPEKQAERGQTAQAGGEHHVPRSGANKPKFAPDSGTNQPGYLQHSVEELQDPIAVTVSPTSGWAVPGPLSSDGLARSE